MGLFGSSLAALGSSGLDFLSSGLSNMWNASTNFGYSKRMARYNADLSKELAEYNSFLDKDLTQWNYQAAPSLKRRGLEVAGYNPILAVSTAGGQPMSVSMPSVSGSVSGSPGRSLDVLEGLSRVNALKLVDAQTDETMAQADYIRNKRNLESAEIASRIRLNDAQAGLTHRRSESEGWSVKTLSRSEASGLGASVLGQLGINLRESKADTFMVAYNPITGELRNLGSTGGSLGAVPPPSNAADIPKFEFKTPANLRYDFNPDHWQLKPEFKK